MVNHTQLHHGPEACQTVQEEIWLLGQPPIRRFLDFVADVVVDGASAHVAELTHAWRAANDYYHELEQLESGMADKVECRELPPSCASLAAEVAAHPYYAHTFKTVPMSFGMVELDKLIAFQLHVSRNFIDALAARLGPAPSLEELFRFCLPLEPLTPPVHTQRVGSKRYVFRSDSTDFRFHDAVLLQPDQIRDYQSFGPLAGVVGLVVGFGSNFLNAIRVGNRLLLHNGYHRACALRQLGITHAPCIIQTATRMDELELIAKSLITNDPDFYFNTARPPLLKDFFDFNIGKVWPVHKRVRMIEVNFEVRDYLLPA